MSDHDPSNPEIKKYTAEELLTRRARGESQTNLQNVRSKTQEQLEKDIADGMEDSSTT